MTGKLATGDGYAPATVAHSETVLRRFYDFHRDAGTGPILNPFPLDISRRSRRARAHHNPMEEWKHERAGRYRPVVPRRTPRAIPDDWFNQLFAALPSDRDRALVAFWISTGARASELLGMRQCDIYPGQQLKSRASARNARSQPTPTASRNRHHRSKSTAYERSVATDFPAASKSRKNTDTGSAIRPSPPTTR